MIYLFTDLEKINNDAWDALTDKLPEGRKKKVLKNRTDLGRKACILGYLVFLCAYRKFSGNADTPEWSVDSNSKPYLKDYPDIFFNISHCGKGIACIISDKPCGIDLQDIRRVRKNVAEKVCSESQLNAIMNAPDKDREFTRIWTVKEAVSKLSGEGIFTDIKGIDENSANTYTEAVLEDMFLTAAGDNIFVEVPGIKKAARKTERLCVDDIYSM